MVMEPPVSRFRAPDTALVMFSIIVCAAILTWFVPAGVYERREIEVPGVGTREVVVPGTYRLIDREERGVSATEVICSSTVAGSATRTPETSLPSSRPPMNSSRGRSPTLSVWTS